jgi:hypothetical protein
LHSSVFYHATLVILSLGPGTAQYQCENRSYQYRNGLSPVYTTASCTHTHQISANGNKPVLLLYTMTKNLWDTQITSTTKKVLLYLIMIYVVVARPLPGHGLDFARTLYGHYLGLAWSMPGRCTACLREATQFFPAVFRLPCHVKSSCWAGRLAGFFYGLFIYSTKTSSREDASKSWPSSSPASEIAGGHTVPF